MPIVRALRHGQVTLPKVFRDVLNIREGDSLEAKLEDGKMVLIPQGLLNKERAWKKVFQVLEQVHESTKHIQAERDALELIQEVRKREYVLYAPGGLYERP